MFSQLNEIQLHIERSVSYSYVNYTHHYNSLQLDSSDNFDDIRQLTLHTLELKSTLRITIKVILALK